MVLINKVLLVKVMYFRLFRDKPLHEPKDNILSADPLGTNFEFWMKFHKLVVRGMVQKCRHFVQDTV